MIKGVVDTNILIELYRKLPAAHAWIATQSDLAVPIISWLEFMEGARGKAGQERCLQILSPFDLLLLTDEDQQWTKTKLVQYRLSHGLSFKDCLIASSVFRL